MNRSQIPDNIIRGPPNLGKICGDPGKKSEVEPIIDKVRKAESLDSWFANKSPVGHLHLLP